MFSVYCKSSLHKIFLHAHVNSVTCKVRTQFFDECREQASKPDEKIISPFFFELT